MPRAAAALVLLVASLAVAPGAQAGFVATNDEVATAPNASGGELGIDGQGNALVAWDQNEPAFEIKARRFAATGALGPVLDLDPGGDGHEPTVAMSASGRAFVAWRTPAEGSPFVAGVQGRWVETDGSLGPIVTLAVGKEGVLAAALLQVVVDPAGVATATWKNEIGGGGGELMLRRVGPDSSVGPLVPDVTGGKPTEPRIAALPNGSTLVVWRNSFIEKTVVGADLALGTPQHVSGDNLAAEPELAIDSQGNALVTWRRDSESTYGVRGRLLDPAGNPLAEDLIFDADLPGVLDNRPIAVDSLGDFLVTWVRPNGGTNVVYARHYNALAGHVDPTQTVSDENLSSSTSLTAIDDFGGGAVTWAEYKGMTGTIPYGRTIDALGAPTGGIVELFSPRALLSGSASAPAAGVAMFILETSSGGNRTFRVRRYLEPPSCANSAVDVVEGKATDVPLACTGPAIEAASVVESPKHGTLGAFKTGPMLGYAPAPGFVGADSFTYSAVNDVGVSKVARVEIRVRQGGPTIESLRFVKGAKRTYSFVLKISEPARATVTVERAARGIRKGKRCVKAKGGATGKPCKRYVKVGKVGAKAAGAKLTLRVPAKLAKRFARGGKFRATALATDLAGARSKPKTISFRIQAKKR